MEINQEKFDVVYEQSTRMINDARKVAISDNPDPMEVDRLDLQITSLMASVGQVFRELEAESNKFKQLGGDMKEVARSLRRIHETLNEERRMTR